MTDDSLQSRIQRDPLTAVVDYYAERLPHSTYALSFLQRRRLAASSELRVGFADRTLGTKLPNSYVKAGRKVRSLLKEVGVLKENGRERLRGLVTVPLTDRSGGNVTGIYGLRVDPSQGEEESTVGEGIFNAEALGRFNEIILCENVLDAWTFCGSGHTSAVAMSGIPLTSELFDRTDRVLLAGDVDAWLFQGKELLRIGLPEGMSVADYVLANKTLDDPLGPRIRAATWIRGASPARSEEQAIKVQVTENSESTGEEEPPASIQPISVPVTSPVPRQAHDELPTEHNQHEVVLTPDTNRRWRIRGLERNTTAGVMRVNVAVFHHLTGRFHVDQLDLYHARSRRNFLAEAAEETGLGEYDLRSDLPRVLLKLEQLQHEQQTSEKSQNVAASMSESERSEAMALLTDERLIDRILEDFETCGIVGEQPGKLAGYLAATSRLLEKPLGLVIQSSSAAGKSALADSVLKLMPSEAVFRCSAMTGQSLYYLGKENLQHKILSIADEEGASRSSYQLKLLQSEGSLSLVATGKESGTGRTSTERYEVRGPVALLMTTTSLSVDPELLNRCLVVAIDESVVQTEAILQRQRQAQTLEGLRHQGEQDRITRVHHNAQRLLRPLRVVNPYASQLGFISSQTRHRRDHQKYLSLIQVVTLLHQYQHEVKRTTVGRETIEYIEVNREDIARANCVADWALGRSIDELAGPTRRLLIELYDWLRETAKARRLEVSEVEFTRRQAREALGWSATYLARHLEHLCQAEYVVRSGGGMGKLSRYRVLYDGHGREGQATVIGLVDAASLVDPTSDATTDDLAQQSSRLAHT